MKTSPLKENGLVFCEQCLRAGNISKFSLKYVFIPRKVEQQ